MAGLTLANLATSLMMAAALYLNFRLPAAYRTRLPMLAGAVASALVLFAFAGISGWGLAGKLFGSGRVPRPLFYLLALLWLPAGVVPSALLRAMAIPPEPQALLSLLTVAPAALPLPLACRRLHRKGFRAIAWAAMAVLSVVTVAATLVAGLLGPAAIVIYALVLNLPVGLAALLLPRREP